MRSLRALLLRLRHLVVGRERGERDFADEIHSHLQLHIDDNIRAGMSPGLRKRGLAGLMSETNGLAAAAI